MTKAVFITGASTGIGYATALRLHERGWRVYAGIRDEASQAHLRALGSEQLVPVRLDVTDPAAISAAVDVVSSETDGLAGLVNNAGIPCVGPVEFLRRDQLHHVLDVNVVGQVAVTQAFLPLLRDHHGRIIFTSSLSGRVAAPFLSGYAASKHALEAVANSLRRELGASIPVSIIEPGNTATPIWDKGLDPGVRAGLPRLAETHYGPGLDFAQGRGERGARTAIPPDRVARVIERALSTRRPRRRYVVGADAHLLIALERLAPELLDAAIAAGIRRARLEPRRAPM